MHDNQVTISQAEYDRLVAIEQAAVGAVKTAIVRKIVEPQHEIWLTAGGGVQPTAEPSTGSTAPMESRH